MPMIDTRHAEKNHLFSLYTALLTGDVEAQIRRLQATMESEDVEQVKKEIMDWKNKIKVDL